MRFLILTNRVPWPLRDGGALAMDAMIRGYKQAGQEVHLLTMNTSRHRVSNEVIDGLYPDLDGFYTVELNNEVRTAGIVKNLLFSSEPEHAARFRDEHFATLLEDLLRRLSPDVVQLESPFLASYIPLIRNHSKALVVYRMHNIEAQIWSRLAGERRGLKAFYLRNLAARMTRYEARLWRDADLLLPITATDADAVKSAGVTTPMVVAPFGIRVSGAELPLPGEPFKVYHLGAMDWLPNQEAVQWFITEVWSKLHKWSPEVTFHFGGRAMPESFKAGLPEGIYCEGEVSDAATFIADKHVLVVPLRAGGGIRIKILEAMAAGKLVVSTTIGMQGIDAQPEIHYLGAETAQDFAHMIAWATAHREKVESIAGSAQALVRDHYDRDEITARILRSIEALLAGKH